MAELVRFVKSATHGIELMAAGAEFVEVADDPSLALRIDPDGTVVTGGQFVEGEETLGSDEYFMLVGANVHIRGILDETLGGPQTLHGILDETVAGAANNPLTNVIIDEYGADGSTVYAGVLDEVE